MKLTSSFFTYVRYGYRRQTDVGFLSYKPLQSTCYPYCAAEIKGRRPYMEDKLKVIPRIMNSSTTLYCVCDGHGGSRASSFVVTEIQSFLESELKNSKEWKSSTTQNSNEIDSIFRGNFNFKDALMTTFKKLDAKFLQIAKTKLLDDGTTALCAVVTNTHLTIANTGDSRALLVKNSWKTEPLSIDHKPNNIGERDRITKLGGTVVFWGVWRVQGILAVSRAIGDRLLKPYVIADPDIIQHKIGEDDSYLILATDGLWDVMTHSDVSNCIKHCQDKKLAAEALVKSAFARGSMDNVSVILVVLDPEVDNLSQPL